MRFEQRAAYPMRGSSPPGAPGIGLDYVLFLPSPTPIPVAHAPAFLAALPCPALFMPTMTQGLIAMLRLDELGDDRHRWAQHTLANQRAGVDQRADALGLTEASPILLQCDDEEHIFSLAVLRCWSERYAVQVGWNLSSVEYKPRASARLMLYRSNGDSSWGGVCPLRSG